MSFSYSIVPSPPIFGKKQQGGVSPTNNQVPAYNLTDDEFKPQSITSILSPVTSNIIFNDNVKLYFGTDSDHSLYFDGTEMFFDSGTLIDGVTFLANVAASASFLRIKRPVNTVAAVITNFQHQGLDSNSNETVYGAIATVIRDNTDGSEDGSLQLRAVLAGTVTTFIELNNPANLISLLQDVSITATKKLYLDGGGDSYIVENSANEVQFFAGGNIMLEFDSGVFINTTTSAIDPTTSNISSGYFSMWKNSTSGLVKLWYNDAGTLKSVTLT